VCFYRFQRTSVSMLPLAGTGSCAYESRVRRHGDVMTSLSGDVIAGRGIREESFSSTSSQPTLSLIAADMSSWWSADASTLQRQNVVDPTRCLDSSYHHVNGCVWRAPSLDGGGTSHHYLNDWSVDASWPANIIDDLLPTSETYKWMTIKRSRTKTGTYE